MPVPLRWQGRKFSLRIHCPLAGFQIQLNRVRTLQFRLVDKSRRRVNMAGCANSDKVIGLRQRIVNFIHLQRHLAKPHHMWAQHRRELAAMAAVVIVDVIHPVQNLPAGGAAHFQQLTVHMNDIAVPCPLMQVVDVLRHQQEVIPQRRFQLCQRQMGGVWLNVRLLKLATTRIVEGLNGVRIPCEAFRRRHIFHFMIFP